MTALFILAQLADIATWATLPPGGEANPLAGALGPAVIPAKAALIAFCLHAPLGRYRRAVLAFGIIAGLLGAASNV